MKKQKRNLFSLDSRKKGNAILDGITIIVVLVLFALGSIFAYYTYDITNTYIQNDTTMSTEAKTDSQTFFNKFVNLFDNLFMFVFVLLLFATLISVFFLDTHPAFFIVTVVMLIALIIVAILLANVYDDVASDSLISNYAEDFVYMTWIMQHLGLIGIITGFMLLVATFIKLKSQ